MKSVTAIFEHSFYPEDLADLREKTGCEPKAVTRKDWNPAALPAQCLIYSSGAGASFHASARWVFEQAQASGHGSAGLSFNGNLPIAPIAPGQGADAWAQALWGIQEALSKALRDEHMKTSEYAAEQAERAARSIREKNEEAQSFEIAKAALMEAGPGLDTDPAFFAALGRWVSASGSDDMGRHRKDMMDMLLKAGFKAGEGVGDPAVVNQTDIQATGRYWAGQALSMGLRRPIHPGIGSELSGHAKKPELAERHLAGKEQSTLDNLIAKRAAPDCATGPGKATPGRTPRI